MAASIRRRGPLSLEVVPDAPESHSEQVTPQRVSSPHHARAQEGSGRNWEVLLGTFAVA